MINLSEVVVFEILLGQVHILAEAAHIHKQPYLEEKSGVKVPRCVKI